MTQGRLLVRTGRLFDNLEKRWERLSTQKNVASILVTVFVFGLALVEFRRQGWLPTRLEDQIPTNHFVAILFPFTLLLLAEVISLVFALAQSVAIAVGKQLEIMSLILIRQSFKELTYLPEPIVWDLSSTELTTRVLYIVSDAAGAILIFGLLVVYFRLQVHVPISEDPDERSSFIGAKKLIAVLLLGSIVIIGIDVTWFWLQGADIPSFFEIFYTVLIFADVFLVLISLRYSNAYPVVFRYFGFAVATVLIRLALTAPRVVDAGLGVIATLFAITLTWLYNKSLQTPAAAGS
jgi:hypothetical protein